MRVLDNISAQCHGTKTCSDDAAATTKNPIHCTKIPFEYIVFPFCPPGTCCRLRSTRLPIPRLTENVATSWLLGVSVGEAGCFFANFTCS
jgi:hypothetical protein